MRYTPEYPILTERLRLRPFTRGDVDAVFAYRQRDDVAKFLFDEPMTREACAEIVGQRVAQVALHEEGDKLILAVERRDSGEVIGELSLILRSAVSQQGEIGYILNPEHHGHGFATEAARELLQLGFAQYELHRIIARCNVGNVASRRVMERLGMRREAHFREHLLSKGHWDEEYIYAVLRREWLEHGLKRSN